LEEVGDKYNVTRERIRQIESKAFGKLMHHIHYLPLSQKDVLTFTASIAQLPNLAELYATSANLKYYNQGDLVYSLAATSQNKSEISKYRKFLVLTLTTNMTSISKANLYYSLGKIDLLLEDKENAIKNFKEAILNNKSIVQSKLNLDLTTREFVEKSDIH